MLIATLPTLTSEDALRLSEKILSHPLIDSVRYNTGGDSPYRPAEILGMLNPLAHKHRKRLYIDLEGRQMRIARWTPFSRGAVILNRDFEIELPGKIYFRGLGWFQIVNAIPGERKVFFDTTSDYPKYYLGETQSTHIVAKKFKVKGYLNGLDREFINTAVKSGIHNFMLSFVERANDLADFYVTYWSYGKADAKPPNVVLKIESRAGIELIRNIPSLPPSKELALMAARDDLFLSYVDKRAEFLDALKLIVSKDPDAILASRIMSGVESSVEVNMGDLADMALMSRFGYRNFMFSDELAKKFDIAVEDWEDIILPVIKNEK